MKRSALAFTCAVLIAALASPAKAQTDFLGGTLTNDANWSAGLPTAAGNPGTIAVNGTAGYITLTNYFVTHLSGTLTMGGFPAVNHILYGGEWTMNGGTLNFRTLQQNNGNKFVLNDGVITGSNSSDFSLSGTSTLTVNGGTLYVSRSYAISSSTFTISNGVMNVVSGFGTSALGTGATMNFNGGALAATNFVFRDSSVATFGGTTVGTATFSDWGTGNYTTTGNRQKDNQISINFLSGSLMSLTMLAPRGLDFTNDSLNNPVYAANEWPKALWETNRLLYNGQSASALGKTWAEVTALGGLGPKTYFNFTGTTLSLVTITYPPGTLIRFQ